MKKVDLEDLAGEEIEHVVGGADEPMQPPPPIGIWDYWPPWEDPTRYS